MPVRSERSGYIYKKEKQFDWEKILASIIVSILLYLALAFVTGELVFEHPDERWGAIASSLLIGFLGKDND